MQASGDVEQLRAGVIDISLVRQLRFPADKEAALKVRLYANSNKAT